MEPKIASEEGATRGECFSSTSSSSSKSRSKISKDRSVSKQISVNSPAVHNQNDTNNEDEDINASESESNSLSMSVSPRNILKDSTTSHSSVEKSQESDLDQEANSSATESLDSILKFFEENNVDVTDCEKFLLDKVKEINEFEKTVTRQIDALKRIHTFQSIESFNWEGLEVSYTSILDEYTKNNLEIHTKLEESFRVFIYPHITVS